MAVRGVRVTYETVREWCQKFGALYASQLRKSRPRIGSKWHLDEVFLKMNGVQHSLWRAVDENGVTIDILVQPKRDRWAALRFFRRLLCTAGGAPRVIITDKLRCSQEADPAPGRTPAESLSEQSMRVLTSIYTHTRKADEAFPEPRTGTTFSLHLRIHQHRFPLPSSSALSSLLSTSAHACTSTLARYGSWCGTSVEHRLATSSCPLEDAHRNVKLTMPPLVFAS
ncbi:transposase-like protein [Granulicella aggregans]|uniref:Transposase-like protein n=1 Tax=Granulicella aggregans TaxID=474949 RepID=A0A7W8E6H8_9BACT|nr:transposase-like protein [Granulicella aggregans]